jgi:HK97 gp10 family phage protein
VLRIDGVEEVRAVARSLANADKATARKAQAVVRSSALAIERGAKLRAPVDTGALRSSINTTLAAGAASISAEVGPEVSYGIFLEYGTWRMPPQPYLGPAFDEVEPSFIAAIEDLGGQALD